MTLYPIKEWKEALPRQEYMAGTAHLPAVGKDKESRQQNLLT
jgi:hypothetical protein